MYLRSTYPYGMQILARKRVFILVWVEILASIEYSYTREYSCSKRVLVYEYSYECEYRFGRTDEYSYSRVYTRPIPCSRVVNTCRFGRMDTRTQRVCHHEYSCHSQVTNTRVYHRSNKYEHSLFASTHEYSHCLSPNTVWYGQPYRPQKWYIK